MNTKEMIEVMQAHAEGKRIEYSVVGHNNWKPTASEPDWAWDRCDYRIAHEPEPKKEGRWRVACLQNIAGFGGIDYQSPFDPKVIVRSTVPVMFNSYGISCCNNLDESCRPGIPVAAWFWKEEEK